MRAPKLQGDDRRASCVVSLPHMDVPQFRRCEAPLAPPPTQSDLPRPCFRCSVVREARAVPCCRVDICSLFTLCMSKSHG
ncbi:hypothetical protein NQZ68_009085 [Dissostichus eleginoides]|nr:hypothetical protein NQZ68_009085 [Dissostichus eleginoides]